MFKQSVTCWIAKWLGEQRNKCKGCKAAHESPNELWVPDLWTCKGCVIVRVAWQREMFYLSSALPCSSRVSVTEVCPAACLHVRRILSLSISWSQSPTPHTHTSTRASIHTDTHTSPCLQTELHNSTRISRLREVYSPSSTATLSPPSVFSLSLTSYPICTRTSPSIAMHSHTFHHTRTIQTVDVICWVPDPSSHVMFFNHMILTQGSIVGTSSLD